MDRGTIAAIIIAVITAVIAIIAVVFAVKQYRLDKRQSKLEDVSDEGMVDMRNESRMEGSLDGQ